MAKLFGTDGVRGEANSFLTPEIAFKLGRAGGHVLTGHVNHVPRVLIAKDGRRSGDMLEAALIAGLCSIGAHVYQAGILPTPAVAFLVKHLNFDSAVMITASHNHMADNGIKFISSDGYKLHKDIEAEIENFMENDEDLPRPTGEDVGTLKQCETAALDYLEYLLSNAPNLNLKGLKIAIDCANGATSFVAERIFRKLGAIVYVINNTPDGSNINRNCGSTHTKGLQDFVINTGANVGLAFDGDGDRVLAVCEKGNVVDGDQILAICGLNLKNGGKLAANSIVATVMSNQGLEIFCKKNDINLIRTDVGDWHVLERMQSDRLVLGGEQSGHVIFSEHSTTGDGILTGIKLLDALSYSRESLSELAGIMEVLPQVLVNVKVPNERKSELATNKAIEDKTNEVLQKLAGEGRILVRPSGTEPVVRVMLEGRDKSEILQMANSLADVIEKTLSD